MQAHISIIGNDILCRRELGGTSEEVRIALTSETLFRMRNWAKQYDRAVLSGDPSLILSLGSDIWSWLDESRWASEWAKSTGHRTLEVAVDDPGSEVAGALLDLPWETLAHEGDFLAADTSQTFVVYRSIGRSADATPIAPILPEPYGNVYGRLA